MQFSLHSRARLCLYITVMLCLPLKADLYLKYKQHTDAHTIGGESVPASDIIVDTRLGKDKARVDHGTDTSVIIDFAKNTVVFVDNKNKTYSEIDLGKTKAAMDKAMASAGADAAQMQQMAAMMQSMMQFKATVTPTAEKKKIAKWTCSKYDLTVSFAMSTTNTTLWTTTDIKVNPAEYQKAWNALMLNMPGIETMLKEFEKIRGVTVLSESSSEVMGSVVKRREELLEAKEGAIPAKTFMVPPGYKIMSR
jgi:hypothetical protein